MKLWSLLALHFARETAHISAREDIIAKAKEAAKTVIVATQMQESTVEKDRRRRSALAAAQRGSVSAHRSDRGPNPSPEGRSKVELRHSGLGCGQQVGKRGGGGPRELQ